METLVYCFLFLFIATITYRFLSHIKHLEGFIYLCSYCKKVKFGDEWISLDDFLRHQTDAKWSHGLCPDCMQKYYGDMLKKHKDKLPAGE
ncbi:MAG: hypothetical protein PHV30_08765 [Candidatus Margulisbacteria bacterium]|nr:hypothetical protein [Candidatus Margulisiibacteriota bacterium]